MFQAPKEIEKPPPPINLTPRPQWMSAMSLRIIYARSDHHRILDHSQNVAQALTKEVIKYLAVDTRRREEIVAEEIRAYLENPKGKPSDIQGEYLIINRWYQHTSGKHIHLSCTFLEKVPGYYLELYQR